MKAGWSAIPNIIIEKQRALGLDALDVNILLHLIQYWWTEDNVRALPWALSPRL
jgi:hypothetical protein